MTRWQCVALPLLIVLATVILPGCRCDLDDVALSGIEEEAIRIRLSSDDFSGILAAETASPDLSITSCCFRHSFSVEADQAVMPGTTQTAALVSISDDGTLAVATDNGTVNGKVIRLIPESNTTPMTIASWEKRPDWDTEPPYLNDNFYRGTLELQVIDRVENDETARELVIINELPLGLYLRGIGETIEDEEETHPEKKKVIAVVSRSYAGYYLDHRKAYAQYQDPPFTGDDDPDSFQKYIGAGFEQRAPNWIQAVLDTCSQVVVYDGAIAKTPYFHSSNGRNQTYSAEEKWGWTDTPYLVSVEDYYDPEDQDCLPCAAEDQACSEKQGHGVGLSGCGSQYLAVQGKSCEEILYHYYQGVTVEYR